jgi:hypothetical protein
MVETVKDCHYPWTWMVVTADGNVKPCCFALGALGNLHDSSAEAVWNGPVAMELRAYIKEDRLHPVCGGAPCKFVQNMPSTTSGDIQSPGEFDEIWYLKAHADVADAVSAGSLSSGWDHYVRYGRSEGRTAMRKTTER